mmetsp:Transcript_57718/g.129441  ORF Transcript_57718/g.129441 Transcript_57718/m.129441 type:complete len:806 (+) Transcript_57718:45-2462(+)
MASRLPASPSLSPGRQVLRSGPQSPALGCRGALPSASANSATVAPAIARHTKSASELAKDQLPAGVHSAFPTQPLLSCSEAPRKVVAGSGTYAVGQSAMPMPMVVSDSAGSSSGQVNGTRLGDPYGGIVQRPYTPKVPGSEPVMTLRSASPNSVTLAPARQTTTPAAAGSQFAAAVRGNSVERRAPQWVAAASPWPKVPTVPLEAQGSPQQTGVAAGGVKLWANGSASSWVSPRKSTGGSTAANASNATASQNRSWSRISQGRRLVSMDAVRPADSMSGLAPAAQSPSQIAPQPADRLLDANAQNVQLQPSSRRAPSNPHLQDEVQVASLRNSLLQHIRSVQKEITKLQQERQKAQQVTMERQASAARPTRDVQVDSNVAVATMCAPAVSRAVTPAERGGDRPLEQQPRTVAEHTAASLSAPVISTAPRDASTVVALDPALQRAHALPVRSGSSAAARAGQPLRAQPQRSFVAKHYAASRIQRAWKIHHWRRLFLDFSASSAGWVGTLEWLQRHCLLYGTELADPEDTRFWSQQRAGAPLDREVDPWGCSKLRDHLNKMWYGRSVEEMLPQEQPRQQYHHSYAGDHDHRNGQVQDAYLMYEAVRGVHDVAAMGALPYRNAMTDHRGLDMRQVMGLPASKVRSKATSVSPRREARLARRDVSTRPKAHVTAATSALQQSPPQTHRSPRLTAVRPEATMRAQSPVQQSASLPATSGMAPIMRQRSPVRQVQATPASGRLSLPGLPAYQSQGGSVTVQSSITAPLAGAKARPVAGGSLAVGPQGRPIASSPPPSFAARLQAGASIPRR